MNQNRSCYFRSKMYSYLVDDDEKNNKIKNKKYIYINKKNVERCLS